MDNKGANETTSQAIPGVKIAPPIEKNAETLVDAQLAAPPVVESKPVPVVEKKVEPPQIVASEPVLPDSAKEKTVDESKDKVQNKETKAKGKKKKSGLSLILFLMILVLMGVCYLLWDYHQNEMLRMKELCTPVSTTEGSKELDLDATIVQDLYSKVATSLREDLGQSELNDELKIYLAYRQVGTGNLYDSHCKSFVVAGMEPFTCEVTSSWAPKAFKADVLQREIKKLFGEDVNIPNQNIQLGNTCIGGFQYIEERGEYVQGQCQTTGATLFTVEKELINATSWESTIVLRERVKYYGSEGMDVPDRLVSGTYEYTFKLDRNYNYVYVSKELVQ